MDYSDIRTEFVRLSGRYDLVDDEPSWKGDGVDFFLNAGQRYLDKKLDSKKMEARYPVNLKAGEYIAKTVGIRSIREVWIANDELRKQLYPMPLSDIRTLYSTQFTLLDRGVPIYYAVAKFRPIPDDLISTTSLNDVDDLITSNLHYTYRGVVITPPPSEDITLSIHGLFYSPTLRAVTNSRSFWTECEPSLLIQSAMMKVSSFYGDPTRTEEHKKELAEDLRTLDYDAVDEALAGKLEMGD